MFAEASLSIWGWGGLGVVLFLVTFGPFAIFYLAFYIFCFIGGGFAVTLLYGKINSEKHLEKCEQSYLPPTQIGILKTLDEMKLELKPIKIDRRLTGSSFIDEPLQQVIQFALRDYIQYWYYTLSEDESFLLEIRQTLQNALVQFSTRSKEVDWQPYFTTRLVDDFATHLRVFRKAQDRLADREDKQRDITEELVDSFFEAEVEMERKICRDVVCTSHKDEEGFLRDLCELLLYLLLPPGDFHNKNMRYFLREVLARGVLLPLINQLSDPEMVKACPTLIPYVYDFLENKAYSKGKGEFARKIDTFVNPLRSSMRNVSNAVKGLPDSLAEGMTKVSDNMGRMSERLGQDIKQSILKVPPLLPKSEIDPDHCRVSAQLDDNVDDNIPLRVMLLLMDEVFDLKEKNQWLRRNIKNLLQQLIRATYGDTINRKIVDHVDYLTSPEQVAEYVKKFRDSYWPNGILAETPPRRDKSIRMRTRIAAKTSLLGIMPDELKHIIGADTTRKGILRVFDMFQYQPMNRRLVYVFLEGFLETMFPQYKFPELFVKLHSRSPRTHRYGQKIKSSSLKR